MTVVTIALAQLDSGLGRTEENACAARAAVAEAREGGAGLIVFPELYVGGYLAGGTATAAVDVAALASGIAAVIGFSEDDGERRFNSAVWAEDGAPVHVQRKVYLCDYPPWSEDASFAAGDSVRAFDTSVGRAAVLICNDAWQPFLPSFAAQRGAELLVLPAASATAMPEVESYWRELTRFYARMLQCYVLFANRVGTEGPFTFWGGSHVVDPWGAVIAEAPHHEETLLFADIDLEHARTRRAEIPLLGRARADVLRAQLDATAVGAHE